MDKTCSACGETKPVEEFPFHGSRRKDGSRVRHARCHPCRREYNRGIEAQRAPENRLERDLKKYGLTLQQYLDLVESQHGLCGGCFRLPEGRLYVDHDHNTGQVRGLLCSQCNSVLGLAGDSASVLRHLAAYLDEVA